MVDSVPDSENPVRNSLGVQTPPLPLGENKEEIVLPAEVVDVPFDPLDGKQSTVLRPINTQGTVNALAPLLNQDRSAPVTLAQSDAGVTVDNSRQIHHHYESSQPTQQVPPIVIRFDGNPWQSPPLVEKDDGGKATEQIGQLTLLRNVFSAALMTRRGLFVMSGLGAITALLGGGTFMYMNWTPKKAREFEEKFNDDLNEIQRALTEKEAELKIQRHSDQGDLPETAAGPQVRFAIDRECITTTDGTLYCGRTQVHDNRGAVGQLYVYNIDRLPDGSTRVSEVRDEMDEIGMTERVFTENDPDVLAAKLHLINQDRTSERYTPWHEIFEGSKDLQTLVQKKTAKTGEMVPPGTHVGVQKH